MIPIISMLLIIDIHSYKHMFDFIFSFCPCHTATMLLQLLHVGYALARGRCECQVAYRAIVPIGLQAMPRYSHLVGADRLG